MAGVRKGSANTKKKETRPPNNKKNSPKKKANDSNRYPRLVDISKDDPTYGWMVVPPKGGEPKNKTVNGAMYYFCPNHADKGAWVKHKPDKCRRNKKEDDKSKKEKKKDKRGSSFARTFAAIMADASRDTLNSDSEAE